MSHCEKMRDDSGPRKHCRSNRSAFKDELFRFNQNRVVSGSAILLFVTIGLPTIATGGVSMGTLFCGRTMDDQASLVERIAHPEELLSLTFRKLRTSPGNSFLSIPLGFGKPPLLP